MRARYPDAEGFVERDGVKIACEVFGSAGPWMVFVPIDPLVHSRAWKAQVPYLAREYRVITVDPRGNGRSDRPQSGAAYADTELVADTIAVMDWLAQHPVTEPLRRRSELIHPASAFLASESGHIEGEAAEQDLHAFQAVRSMDEILVGNFMVFAELTENEPFDLWVGDEAWDIGYFLHENPELKRAPYAWMTDFVGWLPMPDGGPREQALTADYNAEMIEQIARFPALRDRAVFVGNPDDVVPAGFGDGLPVIRDWVERNYRFSGYVSGLEPDAFADRDALRAELGYRPGEQVCLVTVGGRSSTCHCVITRAELPRRPPGQLPPGRDRRRRPGRRPAVRADLISLRR